MTSAFPDLEAAGDAAPDASVEASGAAVQGAAGKSSKGETGKAAASHATAAKANQGAGDPQEAELNRAIEELRGVLSEEKADAAAASAASTAPQPVNAGVIMNIPVEVQIVLGSTEMSVSELMALRQGSTVSLNRRIGEPVDIVVNGRRIACGEITVLDNDPSRFGVKLTQIIDAAKPA